MANRRRGKQSIEDQGRALHHVIYEVAMLLQTAGVLSSGLTRGQPVLTNALIESHALHARNVFEFLRDEYRDDQAVRLAAFGVAPGEIDPALRERWGRTYGYASTRVAHITWRRLDPNPGIPFDDLPAIVDVFLRFLSSVGAAALDMLDVDSKQSLDVIRAWRGAMAPPGVQSGDC